MTANPILIDDMLFLHVCSPTERRSHDRDCGGAGGRSRILFGCCCDVGHKELKKHGVFLVPGFAKFVVVKKPATKARKGTNPFTGEEMMFKAKPARKIVRARPVKAAKDAV